MGTYKALSADPESVFSKLMEWQMTGGEKPEELGARDELGHITEREEIEDDLARQEREAQEQEWDEEEERERQKQAAKEKVAEVAEESKKL